MRHIIRIVYLAALWTACVQVKPPDRPALPNLLGDATRLNEVEIIIGVESAWVVRSASPNVDGAPRLPAGGAGGGKIYRGPPTGGGATRAGPSTPMSTGPGMAGPATGGAARAPIAGQNASPLRAGSTDDNANFEAFLTFLGKRTKGLGKRIQKLDVSDRRSIRVIDRDGRIVPGAQVHLIDEGADKVIWQGRTYGDGCLPFYPKLTPGGKPGPLLCEVRYGDDFARQRWDSEGEIYTLRLSDTSRETEDVELDVVFLIDTTGSMGDEIAAIKATLLSLTDRLEGLGREFALRYGAVLYRDLGDDYVTKAHPFTLDIETFDKALQEIVAKGGGDAPESLNQGLAVAVAGMQWKPGAAKLIFLIADAPPHMDYANDIPYGRSLEAAVGRGIRIHSVAASGLDAAGTFAFRQFAQFTRGKFIFIEYGDLKKTAESHGVKGQVTGNNLDAILFEQIHAEIANWGRAGN